MNNVSSNNILLSSVINKPLGEILIEAGLISANQIEIALQQQKKSKMRIGEILAQHKWIKQKTVDFFVEQWPKIIQQKLKQPLVYYFYKAGLLDKIQIERIVNEQKQRAKKVRFHHLAVEQGYLKQITVDFFLANIFNIYNSRIFSFAKPYEIISNYTQGKIDFRRSQLTKVPLMGVTLKNICLDGSNLREANLNNCNLRHSSLIQVNLTLADLVKAVLTEVNLERSCLVQANLREAHLKQTNFTGANLQGADLREAYLFHASFAGADLRKAKLSQEYGYEVYYNSQTHFDSDFNPQQAGWKKLD